MADTCLWHAWHPTIAWDPDVPVPPDVRTRVTAFRGPVFAAHADFAAVLTDATDADLVAVLGAHVLRRLPRPTRPGTMAALAGLVGDRLEAALDGAHAETDAEARLRAWLLAVNRILEDKAPAVQFASVAVFLERVLRALLDGPETEDRHMLDHVSEGVVEALGALLTAVGARAIPPETYHVM
jgi:hypothetical protein